MPAWRQTGKTAKPQNAWPCSDAEALEQASAQLWQAGKND